MVFFTCSHCGASLKKNKVDKHYAIQCRNPPQVSCMDCHKEFRGNDYAAHTKCITENEKYSGKGFVAKPVAAKQEGWLNIVRTVQETQDQLPDNLKALLDKILSFENIPRKKPKFVNFLNNNRLKINPKDLDLLWDLFEKEQKRVKESTVGENVEKAAETETKDSSVDADQESEASPKKKKKKNGTEDKAQILNGNSENVTEEMEGVEVVETVKTKKNKDKNKQKSDALDDSDMKVPETTESEELTQVKKSKKKRKTLEGTEEAVKANEADQSAEIQSEEVTQGINSEEVTQGSQSEEVILTKKQKKEKKKREKYEAELKEIESSQPLGTLAEEDGGDEPNKNKKKSKKDKHVKGLHNNVKSTPEEQTGENSLKTKKKRSLEDDSADNVIEKKKKKRDVQEDEQMEETMIVQENTIPQQKFQWNETILEVVKSKGGEIPIKRLRKKVLSEYVNCCGRTESDEKLGVKFSKKLQKVPGIAVHKEVVMLV